MLQQLCLFALVGVSFGVGIVWFSDRRWLGIVACCLIGLSLLGAQLVGQSHAFHYSFTEVHNLRRYGWPLQHAWRWEFFELGSSVPSEISALSAVNAPAATVNIIVSVVVLVATFVTMESVRSRRKGLRFSLRSLLTFVFLVAGICGFVVFERNLNAPCPPHYNPLTWFPICVSFPLIAGMASVLNAAVITVRWATRWALGDERPPCSESCGAQPRPERRPVALGRHPENNELTDERERR